MLGASPTLRTGTKRHLHPGNRKPLEYGDLGSLGLIRGRRTEVVGKLGDDVGVLRMSAAIEAERPWSDRWPPPADG